MTSVEPAVGQVSSWQSRTEVIFTLVLALAVVGTAWATFQAAKWGGVQTIAFAEASAARIESARKASEADNLRAIDLVTFTEWLGAVNEETGADPSAYTEVWRPEEGTASAFYYHRFRDEFRPAVDAWLATRPLNNPDAPASPFAMAEYQLAAQAEAEELSIVAEQRAADAVEANQRSDNYVLLGVLFAMVLFFVALGFKTEGRSRLAFLTLASLTLIASVVVLAGYPIKV